MHSAPPTAAHGRPAAPLSAAHPTTAATPTPAAGAQWHRVNAAMITRPVRPPPASSVGPVSGTPAHMPAAYVAQYTGRPPARGGARHGFIVPYGGYRVGDGSCVNLAVQNEGQWRRLCEIVLRRPDLADDPRFATNELRLAHRAELEPLLESLLADDTRTSVETRLTRADVPFGTVNEMDDVLHHPQLEARGRWFDIPSAVGDLRALHHPMNIAGLARPAGAVPKLGEHTAAILAELGL